MRLSFEMILTTNRITEIPHRIYHPKRPISTASRVKEYNNIETRWAVQCLKISLFFVDGCTL